MSTKRFLAASVPPRLAMAGSAVALPILAIEQTGDIGIAGALVAASLAPSVIAAPLVGAALDRTRRPGVMIAFSCLLTAAVTAAMTLLGAVPLAVVFILLILAGAVSPFYMGGLSSFVADVMPHNRRGFAIDAFSYNVSAVGGPAAVALLTLFAPVQTAVLALTASAALGAMVVFRMGLPSHAGTSKSVLSAITGGVKWMLGHRPLAVLTAASTLSQVGQGGLAVAAIAFSLERVGSPDQAAFVVTAFAVGALAGSLYETLRPTRSRPQKVMMLGFLMTGLLTIGATLDLGIVGTVVFIGLSGVFTASPVAAMLSLRNHLSPTHLKAQVFTVGAGLRATAFAAGAALAGTAAATGVGGAIPIIGVGLVWVASAALMAAYPRDHTQLPPDM
ncbi:MFS transporter [Arthrobacter sp. 18067]|uniref:MFS transporter n=1 Tax=Arthrobacter sp. 18067 TaxID=2681413 RepID=UPI0013588104|nr:MFS transporter [Arthrobacter sp. 18067]